MAPGSAPLSTPPCRETFLPGMPTAAPSLSSPDSTVLCPHFTAGRDGGPGCSISILAPRDLCGTITWRPLREAHTESWNYLIRCLRGFRARTPGSRRPR